MGLKGRCLFVSWISRWLFLLFFDEEKRTKGQWWSDCDVCGASNGSGKINANGVVIRTVRLELTLDVDCAMASVDSVDAVLVRH